MDAVLAAKLVFVPTSFLMAGYYTSASQNSVPIIMDQPATVSTPIFTRVYNRGAAVAIPVTVVSTAAAVYLAYAEPNARSFYTSAGAVEFGILPLTAVVMMPGIHKLINLSKASSAEQEKAGQSGEARSLLRAWMLQNYLRAVMSFGAGLLGLWAASNQQARS